MGLISGKVGSLILAGTLATGGGAALVSMTYEGKEALKTVRLWMMDESTKVQQFDQVEGKLLEKINALKGAATEKIGEANDLIAGKNTTIRDQEAAIEELRIEIEGYLEQIASLQAQVENLNVENEQLRAELASANEELERANQLITELQGEKEALTAENQRLNEELGKANDEIEKANDDAFATEAFIDQVETDDSQPLSEGEMEELDITLPEIVDENVTE